MSSAAPLTPPPETDPADQDRLAREADLRGATTPDWRHIRTLQGLADVDAGRLIDDEDVKAWAESLGTDHELRLPQPR